MRSRAFRPIAVLLSVLLLASSPVHAGPVVIRDVIQIIGSYQNPPDLRLRLAGATETSGSTDGTRGTSKTAPQTSDSLLSAIIVTPQDPVVVVAQGDVEGTICDCGDVTVAPGGFPKWPLLFLAAVPLFFIGHDDDCEDCDRVTPVTPLPTPNPSPSINPLIPPAIPEPSSLLLLGTGLAAFGAGLRRRYQKAKLSAQVESTEEG
jgi:hypothetical protein